MRGARGGKVQSVLVGTVLLGGCVDQPADRSGAGRMDSLADPIRAGMVIDLNVTGGPRAGRYHVETLQGSCSRRLFGRGSWAIRYAKEGASPSSLEVTIPDAAAAERGTEGTGEFALMVAFGTAAQRFASGTAQVRDHGGRATVGVHAQTDDGVRLEATIRCNDVLRVAGMDGG